uniref:Uncharacterized protein n=1 Tax=Anguilla anguilla TaxID=7936 RepID=A0A0E9PR61_ANGAN
MKCLCYCIVRLDQAVNAPCYKASSATLVSALFWCRLTQNPIVPVDRVKQEGRGIVGYKGCRG